MAERGGTTPAWKRALARGAVRLALLVMCAGGRALAELPSQPADGKTSRLPLDEKPAPVQMTPIPRVLAQPIDEDNLPPAVPGPGERSYKVRRFDLSYKREHPNLPPISELELIPVELGLTKDGYMAPREGLPTVVIRVGDTFGGVQTKGATFFNSAIQSVSAAIVAELARRQLIGLFVVPDSRDIDEVTADDLRFEGDDERFDLRLVIWTGVVNQVRTVASGDRVRENEQRIDNPMHARIRKHSPIQNGDLIRKDKLDNYALRLNRLPARRVDVALGPTKEPGEVVLDYLVSESKPWTLYGQVSNTGTTETNVWRERVGFVHSQLSNHDDTFRLDYITSSLTDVNALNVGYDRPLGDSGVVLRGYGGVNDYTASDVGLAGEDFTGKGFTVGGEVSVLLAQRREWFLEASAGGRFDNIQVNNEAVDQKGYANIFSPYAALRLTRESDSTTTKAMIGIEGLAPFVTGVEQSQLANLGRLNPSSAWAFLKWDVEHTFYLEPLLNGHAGAIAPADTAPTRGMTLAHEIVLITRGQFTMDNRRLIPNMEQVAGGAYSVRGYPESVSAGDTVILGTAEYRFHLPRTFAVRDPTSTPFMGQPFRWAPQQPYGRADWDLIFRAFVDVGRTVNNQREPYEVNGTLVGTGVGLEFMFKQNLSVRVDWGVALYKLDGPTPVEPGYNRINFILTVLY
ncbi:MAG: ShlB/FhaC/HecB family hemolysin secretion/activation protein [Phycisphaerales bacterium]|nr:ShlB/FhaC/HecB family hemolysin secretion/activation protein [Phycisphaerales bacterium]